MLLLSHDTFIFVWLFFFFKQKTAYEMRISDWSSDVCSSDLRADTGTENRPGRCCISDLESMENGPEASAASGPELASIKCPVSKLGGGRFNNARSRTRHRSGDRPACRR